MELLEIIWFVRRRRTSKKREKNSRKVVPDLLARNLNKVSIGSGFKKPRLKSILHIA